MVVDTEDRDGWQIVSAAGELDVVTSPAVRSEVVRLVTDGATDIVLDFRRVDFIDSFGLGVVVGALKRVNSHDGRLRVVVGEPRVARIFELTGMDRVIDLYDSVDAAIQGPGPARGEGVG